MRAITDAEIVSLRATVAPLFPDTCSVYRTPMTNDGQGGLTSTRDLIEVSVPCRIDPTLWRRPTIFGIADSQANVDPIIITLHYDTDVRANDYLVVDSTGEGFEVLGVINAPSWIVTKQIAVIRSI